MRQMPQREKAEQRHQRRQHQPPDLGRHGVERGLALTQPQTRRTHARRQHRAGQHIRRPVRAQINPGQGNRQRRQATPPATRSGASAAVVRGRPVRRGSGTAQTRPRRGRWACCSWSAGRSTLPGARGRKSVWSRCCPARCRAGCRRRKSPGAIVGSATAAPVSRALNISMLRNSPIRVKVTATSSSVGLRCSCTRVITP